MIIYTIRNTNNGKQLIGQTICSNPKPRWYDHRRRARNGKHVNPHFQSAWNKHGEQSFIIEVLDSSAESMGQLNALEIFYIATTPNIYNIKNGGANGRPSIETRRKLSEAGKGKEE